MTRESKGSEGAPRGTDRRGELEKEKKKREEEEGGREERSKGLTVCRGRWGGLKNYSHSVFPLEV